MLSIRVVENFVEMHAFYAYILLFLGVLFEGEVAVIMAGIFSHLGSLNPFISLCLILLGGISKSFVGYSVGEYLHRKHSHLSILNKIERKVSYFLPKFSEKPFWSIFVSRFFILGLNWFTLLYSGYKKVNKKVYYKAESLSLAVWSVGVLSLGYFFSFAALSVSHDFRKFIVIILLFFIGFFLIEKIISLAIEIIGDMYDTEGIHNTKK